MSLMDDREQNLWVTHCYFYIPQKNQLQRLQIFELYIWDLMDEYTKTSMLVFSKKDKFSTKL